MVHIRILDERTNMCKTKWQGQAALLCIGGHNETQNLIGRTYGVYLVKTGQIH